MANSTTDIRYVNKRAIRGKSSQQGSFSLTDNLRRPLAARLRLFERMVRQDLTIKSAVYTLVNSIVSSIGEITHPDQEIAAFLNDDIKKMEDAHGKGWRDSISTLLFTEFWSGFQVSEMMFELEFGELHLDDLLTYHPITCAIYGDKKGRLIEGNETWDGYHKSGIYQVGLNPFSVEKKLDFWKIIYTANEADYGNYYGRSLVQPAYKWYRLKEALIDMMAAALDKQGKRTMWVRMSSASSDETRIDPATGEHKIISTLELIREQLAAADGDPSYLLLPQQLPDIKPEVGSEPLADAIGSLFLDAIAYADQESVRHILPYFLITDNAYGSTTVSPESRERRMEIFYNDLDTKRSKLCNAVSKKMLSPLVKWNFNRESAKISPTFTRVYSDRPEDRVATMQMVKGLTETGYLNPRHPSDWNMIRQMLRLAQRTLDPDDLKFIEEIVVNPRQKTPRQDDVGRNGSGSNGRPTGNTTKQIPARLS